MKKVKPGYILEDVKLNTIFIYPPNYDKEYFPHLGIPLLHGFLKKKGYKSIQIIDFNRIYNTKIKNVNIKIKFFLFIKKFLNLIRFQKNTNDDNRGKHPFLSLSLKHILDLAIKNNIFFEKEEKKIYSYVKSYIIDKNPDLIGISVVYPYQIFSSLLISKIIKKTNKNIFIVFGGSQITKHIKYLRKIKDLTKIVDGFIIGDGEEPVTRLIYQLNKSRSLKEIPNFYFKNSNLKNKEHYIKSNNSYYYDFQEVIIPDFLNFQIKKILPIRVSVGCPWGKCTFCNYKTLHKKNIGYEPKDAIQIIKKLIEKHKINCFEFVDNALDIKFLEKFSKSVIKENLKIAWTCKLIFQEELLNESLVKTIANAGCKKVLFGLESTSPRILKLMNKSQKNIKTIKEILKLFKKYNIYTLSFIIFGFPSETKEEAEFTLSFLMKNKKLFSEIKINSFTLENDTLILKNPSKFYISKIYKEDKNWGERLGFYYKTKKGMSPQDAKEFKNYARKTLSQKTIRFTNN